MKKLWAKILYYILLIGFALLGYASFFDKVVCFPRYRTHVLLAALIGGAIVLLVLFLAKKTGVEKEINDDIDMFIQKHEHERELSRAMSLICLKCTKSYLREDIQDYVCPLCGAELSIRNALSNKSQERTD